MKYNLTNAILQLIFVLILSDFTTMFSNILKFLDEEIG